MPATALQRHTAILSMIIGVACMAAASGVAKQIIDDTPVELILFFRFTLLSLFLLPLMNRERLVSVKGALASCMLFLRSLMLLGTIFLFFTSLRTLELATATSVLYLYPLMLSLCYLVFGRTVTWFEILLLFVGFIGVCLLLQANLGGFAPWQMLAFMICPAILALRIIVDREYLMDVDPIFLVFCSSLVCSICLYVATDIPFELMDAHRLYFLIILAGFASAGQVLILIGYRHDDVSLLSSIAYLEVVFSMLISLVFFDLSFEGLQIVGLILIGVSYATFFIRDARALTKAFGQDAQTSTIQGSQLP